MKILILLFCMLLFETSVSAQAEFPVKNEGITSALHQKNIGRITFMGSPVPIEDYKESDFLTAFTLKDTTDFNLRVYLDNSLTNYLHLLEGNLTAEELVAKGNFRFSFFVDDKLVYNENLNPGAYGRENKNSRTVFRVSLISSANEDHWGRFLWNRFLLRGGEDALTDGTHTLKIEIRPYVQSEKLIVGEKIAEGQIQIIIPVKPVTENQLAVQKILPGSGWAVSSDAFDKMKIRELNRMIAINRFKNITGIVIIKNGKLLLEEYFNNANRQTLHDTRSVGKSFASALTGIAIRDQYLKSENQPLSDFYSLKEFQNFSAIKETISIKDLLTMSSAFEGSDMDEDSPGNEEKMYPADNWVKFTLDLPASSIKANGKQWDYFTAGVVLLGDILNRSVPGGLEKYAHQKLMIPLGIKNYKWGYTPQRVVNTAGGLQMNALDFARFGQLYKNNGVWNKKQVIPADWASKSLSHQIQIPQTEQEFYGYLFWNKTFTVNGNTYETYYCSGNGGNKIFIFKNQPFVIVITSTAYNTPYGHHQVDKIMQNYLIPALIK